MHNFVVLQLRRIAGSSNERLLQVFLLDQLEQDSHWIAVSTVQLSLQCPNVFFW